MTTTGSNLKLSIRKNDQVQIIAGKDKGKIGKVLGVSSKTGRVTVEKLNMVKRHVKPSQKFPQGGVIEKELAMHYSNVLLYCSKCARGVRHGVKQSEKAAGKKAKGTEGKSKQVKVRVCKRCATALDAA